MKIALCCIGRMENQYAIEFVQWYRNLGFDKILVCDNNYDGEECFESVLGRYMKEGLVEIIDFRNQQTVQLVAYSKCYSTYQKDYDWMAFFDFDEFLVLKNAPNIKDFLKKFDRYNCLKINWMVYSDNNWVTNDGRPLNKRFSKPVDFAKSRIYNSHTKCIVRCKIANLNWTKTPHVPTGVLRCCNPDGKEVDDSPFQEYTFKNAYLKHFTMKTIQEWVEIKTKRGFPDGNKDYFKTHNIFVEFFKLNEVTDKKIEYIKALGADTSLLKLATEK